ncbi:MAG: MMPL family transporter, partial [Myxococcota bacterium]
GRAHYLALFPELPGAQGFEVAPTVDSIRQIRDAALEEAGVAGRVAASLTGPPALAVDEEGQIQKGLATTSAATGLAILVLLYFAFRSLRYTLLALVPTAVGVAATMAVARAIYGELNMVTSSCASVLLALGIDFGVFLLSRYGEEVRAGGGAASAIQASVKRAGTSLLVGAITTATAFLTTTTTEFTAYARLGVIVAIGLLLMMVFTLVLMPALLWVAGRGEEMPSPELSSMAALVSVVRRGRGAVVAFGVLGAIGGGWAAQGLSFNTRFYDFIPERGESAAALLAIEGDPAITPLVATTYADGLDEARALKERLLALDSVAAVQSPSDLLPALAETELASLRKALATGPVDLEPLRRRKTDAEDLSAPLARAKRAVATLDALGLGRGDGAKRFVTAVAAFEEAVASVDVAPRLAQLEAKVADLVERAVTTAQAVVQRGAVAPPDLPEIFRARYVARDDRTVALYIVPKGNIWDPEVAKRFADSVSAADPRATGMAMHVDAHLRFIREGFSRAAVAAAGLVFLILLLSFRHAGHAALALVPTLVGFGWMLGIMRLVGLDFDAANIVVLPLIMGIGVDAGVHLIHRMRQSADERDGIASIDTVVRGTGAAVALASLTTIAGFASLMLAEYGAMKSLGLAMTIGIASTLLASVLVLPSMMLLFRRAE